MSDTVQADRPAAPGVALLCDAFSKPAREPCGEGARLVVINTRMSQVLLAGRLAIKLRRAWPAFEAAGARRAALTGELRCNQRLSPSVYLGVLPIPAPAGPASQRVIESIAGSLGAPRSAARGSLTVGWYSGWPLSAWPISASSAGEPPVADWALVMRRLPRARMLDQAIRAGTTSIDDMDRVAVRLAGFYMMATPLRGACERVLAGDKQRIDSRCIQKIRRPLKELPVRSRHNDAARAGTDQRATGPREGWARCNQIIHQQHRGVANLATYGECASISPARPRLSSMAKPAGRWVLDSTASRQSCARLMPPGRVRRGPARYHRPPRVPLRAAPDARSLLAPGFETRYQMPRSCVVRA